MIRPSPEIAAIVRRFTSAIRTHAVADLPHYFSQDEAVVYIGTADGEIWQGPIIRDGISAHMAEIPDFTETDVDIAAFENGETGWAHYSSRFHFARTGATGSHRATVVFVLQQGSWKMIQHHISEATRNMPKLGIEHTAFQALLTAAQAANHDFGTEGLASIMFTDIAGSTRLAAMVGDRMWMQVLDRHMGIVRACLSDHGGELVKSLGDGTMSAFPSARNALTAALDLQARVAAAPEEPALALRIGIHTGEVIRASDDFFGTVVNKAARVADSAAPGEIRVTDAARLIAGEDASLHFTDPDNRPLRGLPGTHLTYRLTPP